MCRLLYVYSRLGFLMCVMQAGQAGARRLSPPVTVGSGPQQN